MALKTSNGVKVFGVRVGIVALALQAVFTGELLSCNV